MFSICIGECLLPAVASQYPSLPASAGHSHSIVNEHENSFIINAIFVGLCLDTMKNTMLKKCWDESRTYRDDPMRVFIKLALRHHMILHQMFRDLKA